MVILLLLLLYQSLAAQQPFALATRTPLEKTDLKMESPKHYAKRLKRTDTRTGKGVYYDPKPQIVLLDAKSGRYAVKWIGYGGTEFTVYYDRPDVIEAVVAAAAERRSVDRPYLFTYQVHNLRSSGQHLGGFSIQNFTSSVRIVKIPDVYIGPMTAMGPSSEGNWIRGGLLPPAFRLAGPGTVTQFRLESSSPPGLVQCRVDGGRRGIQATNINEDMPQELESALPGYEVWPSGFTIGPIDRLKDLSVAERADYVRRLLPQLEKLGWIVSDAIPWYAQNLKGSDLRLVGERVRQDLKAGKITTELASLLEFTSK